MNRHAEKGEPGEKSSIDDESLLVLQLLRARQLGDVLAHFG